MAYYENNKKLSINYKKNNMIEQKLYYDFSKQLPNNLEVSGLSGIENWGRWSDGPTVEFRLCDIPVEEDENLILNFYTHPFTFNSRQDQTVKVFVNYKYVDTWKYRIGQLLPNTTIEIPYNVLNKKNIFIKIRFEIENPVSPKELGYNEDTRKIAIGFKNLIIDKQIRNYDFSKELPNNLVVSGLSLIEEWGRWTDNSVVEFELSDLPIKDLILKFDTIAFLTEKLSNQMVQVFVNYKKFKIWSHKSNQIPNTIIEISQQLLQENNGHLFIRFEFENQLFSPFELGLSGDYRKLGIGFKKLIIIENNNPYSKITRI